MFYHICSFKSGPFLAFSSNHFETDKMAKYFCIRILLPLLATFICGTDGFYGGYASQYANHEMAFTGDGGGGRVGGRGGWGQSEGGEGGDSGRQENSPGDWRRGGGGRIRVGGRGGSETGTRASAGGWGGGQAQQGVSGSDPGTGLVAGSGGVNWPSQGVSYSGQYSRGGMGAYGGGGGGRQYGSAYQQRGYGQTQNQYQHYASPYASSGGSFYQVGPWGK